LISADQSKITVSDMMQMEIPWLRIAPSTTSQDTIRLLSQLNFGRESIQISQTTFKTSLLPIGRELPRDTPETPTL